MTRECQNNLAQTCALKWSFIETIEICFLGDRYNLVYYSGDATHGVYTMYIVVRVRSRMIANFA